MDLNRLLYHHQIALMAARQAGRDGHLLSNFDLPRNDAKRINAYRERRGRMDGLAAATEPAHVGPKRDPAVSEPGTDYPLFDGDTPVAELLVTPRTAHCPGYAA